MSESWLLKSVFSTPFACLQHRALYDNAFGLMRQRLKQLEFMFYSQSENGKNLQEFSSQRSQALKTAHKFGLFSWMDLAQGKIPKIVHFLDNRKLLAAKKIQMAFRGCHKSLFATRKKLRWVIYNFCPKKKQDTLFKHPIVKYQGHQVQD